MYLIIMTLSVFVSSYRYFLTIIGVSEYSTKCISSHISLGSSSKLC